MDREEHIQLYIHKTSGKKSCSQVERITQVFQVMILERQNTQIVKLSRIVVVKIYHLFLQSAGIF